MKVIVQKFGGTSVATPDVRAKAVQKVINARKSGYHPVVVVSAMGRNGAPYATDTLIALAKNEHVDTHPRELDLLMSCGEIISSVIMVNALRAKGYEAVALTGGQAGIITDNNFGSANILRINPDRIYMYLEMGKIPVVAGFQGVTEGGDITTLGRGGSDTTAAALGKALSASFVEIYTDVDGIMTADPRLVPNATVLKHLTYSEVFQMADQGAKVIHPKAVEIAMSCSIPLIIKNINGNGPGTIVSSYDEGNYAQDTEYDPNQVVTSISHMLNRTQVLIENVNPEFQNIILSRLAENGISIDLINVFPDKMIFTIDGNDADKAKSIFEPLMCRYSMIHNCSKISAIGNRMRGVPGVMARVLKALVKNQIQVLQTADSHTTISCLIKGEDTAKALMALHDEFKLHAR
ncbi:aspartate kinase [Caldicoprobacter guelmensis]|uniref:aspartate kinase n=1 Tax=Caldicoprobacter guelmensis TaxID=1170224 RepID=UPI00195C2154|nr:aspartate kinase [Caldicoprobacter guelmensis]MBM7581468.1 aspartate kinase [Caldicoprobacter guelmensis]